MTDASPPLRDFAARYGDEEVAHQYARIGARRGLLEASRGDYGMFIARHQDVTAPACNREEPGTDPAARIWETQEGWVRVMTTDQHADGAAQPKTLIENADALRDIMAGAIAQATAGTGRRSVYRAHAKLTKNLTVEVQARDFTLQVDEPPSFGGADAGPNPEEVVLAGVGACQVITAALYAAYLGISISRYEVQLRGYADLGGFYGLAAEGTPTGFDRVVCEVTLESAAPAEKLAVFERLVEDRCVGHGTLRWPVSVETQWTFNGQPAGDATALSH